LGLERCRLVQGEKLLMHFQQSFEEDVLRLLDFEILADPFQVFAAWHFLHEGLNLPLVKGVALGHLKIEIKEFKDS